MMLQDSGRKVALSLAMCAGLSVWACRSSEPHRTAEPIADAAHVPPAPVRDAPHAATKPPWEGASSILSNGDTYRVYYRTSTSPPPRGELFAVDVWVLSAQHADQGALRDVTLTVDAAMPEHEHGMNRIPISTALGDGRFRIEGLLFHMSGLWQIYFDVTRASVTERAQIDVVLG